MIALDSLSNDLYYLDKPFNKLSKYKIESLKLEYLREAEKELENRLFSDANQIYLKNDNLLIFSKIKKTAILVDKNSFEIIKVIKIGKFNLI